MNDQFKSVYFIGIGGIGMSALARYFHCNGKHVAGYDRVSTPLTRRLEDENICIHYCDDINCIDPLFLDPVQTIVVYTPAIPESHGELRYFIEHGFRVMKRSQILGVVAQDKYVMAVAGTHGKTSTSTMLAWFNNCAALNEDGSIGGGSAFLGGISKNFDSNLLVGPFARLAVEADEFDRSFLRLFPNVAVITSVDADHLDIYHTHAELKDAFSKFASQIVPGGALIYKHGIDLKIPQTPICVYTYALTDSSASFYCKNIRLLENGLYCFDIVCPDRILCGCSLGIPGMVNVENCVAAVAMMWVSGFDEQALIKAMADFKGVKRRMDVRLVNEKIIYIDDYAHHPSELESTIRSIGQVYPDKTITAVFQPHLYTRTRDFAQEFAKALSRVDRLILLPIYPAREEPIEGVDSGMILDMVTIKNKKLVEKEALIDYLKQSNHQVLVTFGAGDIDTLCDGICRAFE